MSQKLIMKNLDKFGLNSYEARSYLALLEKSQLTASEVSRLAGIPRSRIYETLEKLELMGLCQALPGKVKIYTANSPRNLKDLLVFKEKTKMETKLQKLRSEISDEERRLAEKVESAESMVEWLMPVYEKGRLRNDPLDYIEIIKEDNQLQRRVCELIDGARKEVLAFSKPPLVEDRELVLEQLEREKNSLHKGILSKCIYEIPKKIEQLNWLKEYIGKVSTLGEEVKVIEVLPIKLLIFDRQTVIFQLEDPVSFKPSSTTQIIQHKSLANSLKILFDTLWAQALDVTYLDDYAGKLLESQA